MPDEKKTYLFRDPSLWLGRLQNIVTAINETIDQTDMQIEIREKVSEASGMFKFQLLQIKSLKSMLEHMKAFGEEIVVKSTKAVVKQPGNPRLDLLRTAFHELSTDLNLVQRALNQRLWAVKLSADEEKLSQETSNRLVEDLKKWLKEEIAQSSGNVGAVATQKPNRQDKKDRKNGGIFGSLKDDTGDNAINAFAGLGGAVSLDTAIDTVFEHEAFEFVGSKIGAVLDVEVRSKQTQTLIYADILANYALLPAQNLVSQPESSSSIEVVTYFTENNVSVRILPYYTDIILVGLPYSAGFLESLSISNESVDKVAQLPWEFLSIPHEVGHYLFWNGRVADTDMDEYLRNLLVTELNIAKTDWRYHWLEELFADAFKCMLMGPVAVLGLQAMLSDAADKKQLFHNNGYHPIPAFRPLVASKIVEKLAPGKFPNALAELNSNWNAFLKTWDFSLEEGTITVGGSNPGGVKGQWINHMHRDQPGEDVKWGEPTTLTYDTIVKELDPVLDKIIDALKDVQKQLNAAHAPASSQGNILSVLSKSAGKDATLFPWKNDLQPTEGLGDLISQLSDHLKSHLVDFDVNSNPFKKREPKFDIGADNIDLVGLFEKQYIKNWGDKGPRGGGTIGV